MKKLFVYEDAKSHKFWEIEYAKTSKKVTIRYGKVGWRGRTDGGTTKPKSFKSPKEAVAYAEKQIAEKTKKGYEAPGKGKTVGDITITDDPTITKKTIQSVIDAQKNAATEFSITTSSAQLLKEVFKITTLEKLTLHTEELKKLPDEIGNLVNITRLSIENNKLTELPAGIGKLTKLKRLWAYSNQLKSLPDEFGDLESLEDVTLWSNDIKELPKTIGRLKNLREIDLKRNPLTTLPDEIGDCENLVQLELNDCAIKTLPSTMKKLEKLNAVELEDNGLTEIPVALCDIPNLQQLVLTENKIKTIPSEIGRMQNLRQLVLGNGWRDDGNTIKVLPPELFTLKNLTKLDVSKNKITEIPADVGNLKNLETLELSGNPIKNVPQDIVEGGRYAIFVHLGLVEEKVISGDGTPEEKKAIVAANQDRIDKFRRHAKDRSHNREMLPDLLDFISGKIDEVPPGNTKDYYGFEGICDALADYHEWTFIDRRILVFITQDAWCYQRWNDFSNDYFDKGYHEDFYRWLNKQIKKENDPNTFQNVLAELTANGIDEDGDEVIKHVCAELNDALVNEDGEPTSAGRYLLDNASEKAEYMVEVTDGYVYQSKVVELMINHAPEAFEEFIPRTIFGKDEDGEIHGSFRELGALLTRDKEKYWSLLEEAIEKTECAPCCMELGRLLVEFGGDEHRAKALELVKTTLEFINKKRADESRYTFPWSEASSRWSDGTAKFIDWILRNFKGDAQKMVFDYVENTKAIDLDVTEAVAAHLGQAGIDIICEALYMQVKSNDIAGHYRKVFKILEPLDFSAHYEKVWEVATCDYEEVRDAACSALARVGSEMIPKATELLGAKSASERDAGARILAKINSDDTRKSLSKAVDAEKSEDVRDLMVAALYSADDTVTAKEIERRVGVAKDRKKLSKPVKPWADETKLPKLKWAKSGKAVSRETVRFLLYRQNRIKAIEPEAECAAIYALIDKKSGADFAHKLYDKMMKNGGPSAKTRFACTVIGMLGDDRVVGPLTDVVIKRQNLNAVAIIGLVATDEAARSLDEIQRVYRTKYPNVRGAAEDAFNQIAENRGVTPFELADTILPGLGFEDLYKPFKVGNKSYKAFIEANLKPVFIAPDDKVLKSIPKAAAKKTKEEFKALNKEVRALARQQVASLEQSMVSRRRWTAKAWREFFFGHPVMFALARNLLWGLYSGDGAKLEDTFVVSRDQKFSASEGKPLTVSAKHRIGIPHPFDVGKQVTEAWTEHFEEEQIKSPVPQLGRDVFMVSDGDKARGFSYQFEDQTVNSSTFKYRAFKAGWRRGSVIDGGGVANFRKAFPSEGIEVFVNLEGMGVVSDWDGEVTLKGVFFVKTGEVETGSYIYDEPRNEDDTRLIRLGDLPPLVYSETIRDLREITRQADE